MTHSNTGPVEYYLTSRNIGQTQLNVPKTKSCRTSCAFNQLAITCRGRFLSNTARDKRVGLL